MLHRRRTSRTRKGITATALILLLIFSALSAALLSGCNSKRTVTGIALGSYYSVEYTGKNSDKEIEALMSVLDADFAAEGTGDIGKINAAPVGEPVKVDEYTFAALKLAFGISTNSSGAFNPAAFPLTKLWRFAPSVYTGTASSLPDAADIEKAVLISSVSCFRLNEADFSVTKLVEGAMLDLGAIGKGFAADRLFEIIDGKGIADAGATFRVSEPVKMYIQNPRGSDYVAEATVSNIAVSTGGDYQRYYFVDGKRIHHIMGKDGYPAGYFSENPVVSVTVTGESAAICDALSTALMVTGYCPEAEALLELYGCQALLFTEMGYYEIGDSPFEVTKGVKLN